MNSPDDTQTPYQLRFEIKHLLLFIGMMSFSFASSVTISNFQTKIEVSYWIIESIPEYFIEPLANTFMWTIWVLPITFFLHFMATIQRKIQLISNDFFIIHSFVTVPFTGFFFLTSVRSISTDNLCQWLILSLIGLQIAIYIEGNLKRKEKNQALGKMLVSIDSFYLVGLGILAYGLGHI